VAGHGLPVKIMQLTFRDIEKAFGINEPTLYQWLNAKGMPAARANDQYYFNSVEVLEWALKNRIALTPGALKLCEKNRAGKDILTPALMRGGVFFGLAESRREDIFAFILQQMPLPEHVDRKALAEMLLSREQSGSTAIGNGIAIPHVKHPVVLAGTEPLVGLFFLERPVDFAALDGKGVDILFVIFTTSFKGHLSLLSRLAFCLQDSGVHAALARRNDAAEILAAFQVAEANAGKAV